MTAALAAAARTAHDVDYRFKHKAAGYLWLHDQFTVMRDAQGTPTALIGSVRDITARKQAEEALRRDSQARLQRAESVAHFGNWAIYFNTRVVYTSAGARLIYGLHGETWSIAEVQSLPLPEYRATLDAALKNLIEHQQPYNLEFRIQRPTDDQLRDIHSIAEYDPVRHIVFGVIQDITAREQLESQLQISLTKYQTLFETLPVGITIADRDGQITESNQAAINILGLSKETQTQHQIDGAEWRIIRPDGSLMPPDEFASVRALKEQRQVSNVEMGLVKGAAQTSWISVTGAPLALEAAGVIIAYMDITERKQAEEALRQSEARWHTVINASPDGLCITALDGTIRFASDKLLSSHGLAKYPPTCWAAMSLSFWRTLTMQKRPRAFRRC